MIPLVASLIAANISAEPFIGMSGSGFAIGSYAVMVTLAVLFAVFWWAIGDRR
jgi:hypothetical protein